MLLIRKWALKSGKSFDATAELRTQYRSPAGVNEAMRFCVVSAKFYSIFQVEAGCVKLEMAVGEVKQRRGSATR